MGFPRTISAHGLPDAAFRRQVAEAIDSPVARANFTIGAEGSPGANDRVITIQMVDRLGKPWKRRWLVDVWITLTPTGAMTDTQSVTLDAGEEFQEVTANQAYRFLTDALGKIILTINVTGAGSRVLHVSSIGGEPASSGAIAWT